MNQNLKYIFPIGVVLAAVLPFLACANFGFLQFDDGQTIFYNNLIKNPTFTGLLKARIVGMYVPVSAMFYALVYKIAGENAAAFHIFSLFLHAATSLAVFFFVKKLLPGKDFVPFFAAILFAVHPVKTEPICWIASQTTLTFSLFYVLSLISWLNFRDLDSRKWFWFSLLFFVLAGLSKSAAVTLPLVLIALDWFRGRIKNGSDFGKMVAAVLPFLAVSFVLGIYTFISRAEAGAVVEVANKSFHFGDRILMICHAVLFYLYKLLLPLNLSINYPMEKTGGSWSIDYYLSPIILTGLAYLVYKLTVKYSKNYAISGLLFILPLSIMLPLFSVGSFELLNDRYLYIPSLGVFLFFLFLIEDFYPKIKWYLFGGLSIVYAGLSFNQTKTWKSDAAVFGNCANFYPESAICNCNLAYGELNDRDFENAVKHYSQTLKIDPTFVESYNGRGNAYFELRKFAEAGKDFDAAIKAGLSSPKLFLNSGKCQVILNKPAEAIPNLNKSIELEPKNAEAYYFKAVAESKLNQIENSLKSYTRAIEINPNYIEARVNRGLIYSNNQQWQAALDDYNAALNANPNVPIALNNRAYALLKLGQTERALSDINKAIQIQPDYKKAFETKAAIEAAMGISVKK